MTMKILHGKKQKGICGTLYSSSHERTAARDTVIPASSDRYAVWNQPDLIFQKVVQIWTNEDKVFIYSVLNKSEEMQFILNRTVTLIFVLLFI